MKNSNRFLLLIVLAALCFPVRAQVNFGIKAGANLSNIHQVYKYRSDEFGTKMKVGFHIGLISDMPINEMLSFQPGILFTSKGWNFDMNEFNDLFEVDGYSRVSLSYLEIPLNLAYKSNALQIYAGPYLAIGIGGKNKMDYSINFPVKPINFKDEWKLKPKFGEVKEADLEKGGAWFTGLDYGFNFGLGYNFGPILIQGGYSLGLGNMRPKYEDDSATDRSDNKDSNRVITLSVSYFFGN